MSMKKTVRLSQLVFVIGGLLFAGFGYYSFQSYAGYENWPQIQAMVTETDVRTSTDSNDNITYYATILHRYEFAGKSYIGSRSISANSRSHAERIGAEYLGGPGYLVKINPNAPDTSTTEDNPQLTGIGFMAFGGLFVVIALGMFLIKLEDEPDADDDDSAPKEKASQQA